MHYARSTLLYIVISSFTVIGVNCSNQQTKETTMTIKDGSKVSINYTLKVEGEVVDTSQGREPLQYTQGSGQIIPGLEKELKGLKKGDKKSVTVNPDEGYGRHNPDAIQKVPRDAFKDTKNLKKGDVVGGNVSGQRFQAVVVDMNEKEVTLDLNHPLAGKTLNFDIEIVNVE